MKGSLLRLLLPFLLLLLAGCAGLVAPADPRPAAEVAAQAEELVKRKAYADAAELYATAIAKQPDNGRYYLRRSELLEALGLDKESRATYRHGLSRVAKDSPEYLETMYRLALLSADHLQDIDSAEDLLAQLPTGSAFRLDLAGYLYYQANQYELAIRMFNQALGLTTNPDQKAIVLYHAALVYDALKDEKNSVTSLFHAINNATHLGLIRDISALWAKVNAGQPLPQQGKSVK